MIVGNKFHFKQKILNCGTKFSQKVYLRFKTEKSHFWVGSWSLLTILNFSARGPTNITAF